jgi:hypothetical protein
MPLPAVVKAHHGLLAAGRLSERCWCGRCLGNYDDGKTKRPEVRARRRRGCYSPDHSAAKRAVRFIRPAKAAQPDRQAHKISLCGLRLPVEESAARLYGDVALSILCYP